MNIKSMPNPIMGIAIMLKRIINRCRAHISAGLDSIWGIFIHTISSDNPSSTDIKPFTQVAVLSTFLDTYMNPRSFDQSLFIHTPVIH